MVDEFSGDFTYNIPVINIPGPQGSDYPLSLSYHSGATPEEEASWVGYGWTLNPGAINRNTRGFPDDYNEASVTYWNKMPANWTVTAGVGVGFEAFSKDLPANASLGLRYNNNQGYGYNAGLGLSLGKGVVSLGYNVSDGSGSFSASINPVALITRPTEDHAAAQQTANSTQLPPNTEQKKPSRYTGNKVSLMGGNHGLFTYSEVNHSSKASNYYGGAFNVSLGLQFNPFSLPVGVTTNVSGSLSWQKNVELDRLNAYGYMYSANAGSSSSSIQDYYTEKETPYNKRDVFLGIPFNNADVFSVSGEGVGGGFRLYHEKIGEFTPNTKTSNIGIVNIAPEIDAGLNFGLGNDFSAGWQKFSEGAWEAKRASFSSPNEGNDDVFFRFANDLGGQSASLGGLPDEPVSAQLNPANLSSLTKTELEKQLKLTAAHERSSFIVYHTVEDIRKQNGSTRPARLFSQRQDLPVNYADLSSKAICEMSITTATGGRYIYGLPVLSKNEGNLQYSIKNDPISNNYTASTTKSDNQIDVKVGEVRTTAYANSFPLTEIHTPDYVDRTLDGPSPDDFGGYTRFNYIKKYGGTSSANWYNWRMPYNGLLYQANSLSDKDDDAGVVSYGQKEVVYLQSVQTKTHTAVFVTADRDDSRDAGIESEGPNSPRARTGAENPTANKSLQKLVRIDLYVNDDIVRGVDGVVTPVVRNNVTARPIKSVHFSYNNDLFRAKNVASFGLPNATKDAANKRQGKLTLTKIWFEYQGIPTKVSPYTFSYAYPSSYSNYPEKYRPNAAQSVTTTLQDGLPARTTTTSYYDQLTADIQNPVYDPFSLDAWGNYRKDGPTRAGNMQAWLDQRDIEDYPTGEQYNWDPAAWQLKGITLPTGGQIQVQYEQDDYAYVQNKPVHAMASLANIASNGGISGNRYYLDLATLGLNTTEEKEATRDALRKQYLTGGTRKIFFKFLYSFTESGQPTLNPLTRNTEYISGYATVKDVAIDNTGKLYIDLDDSSDKYTLPHQVCKNFLQTQRAGKLGGGSSFEADQTKPERAVRDLISWFKTVSHLTPQCASINWGLSYFRIPLVKPKKGGGLRVKRLLTFDKTGLDSQAVLYGSEYSYRMQDSQGNVISSGVATTEPSAMREENILVDYLPRHGQSLGSKIIAGIDRKQTEGPLGESLLPAPSVGYSRVVVRNIHSGRTTTGYSVSEFWTARDYPMQVKYTDLQSKTQYKLQTALLATNLVNNVYATQGYSFILNNMHGQIRRKATYAGQYPGHKATSIPAPTNEQKYTYYEPAKIDQNRSIIPGDFIPITQEQGKKVVVTPVASRIYPGREVDITSAQKAVKDVLFDFSIETDVTVGIFFFPQFYAPVVPSLTRSESSLFTHATSKVVRYPAVVKRVEVTQDGITHTTENIAFDRFSGQSVQTKANDEFRGGYVQESTQAAWVRPELGPKYDRENLILKPTAGTTTIAVGTANEVWLSFTGSACDGLNKITRGDHLAITTAANDGDNALYFADAPDFINNRVRLYPVVLPITNLQSTVLPSGISNGSAVTAVQIVTSGRRNLLTAAAGSTTYHDKDYANLATIAPFTTPSKYSTSPFTGAINGWLGGNSQTTSQFPSNGTYSHINISAYANKLPVGCIKDPSDATISNVVMARQLINGKTKVTLVSFTVACDGGGTSIVQNQ